MGSGISAAQIIDELMQGKGEGIANLNPSKDYKYIDSEIRNSFPFSSTCWIRAVSLSISDRIFPALRDPRPSDIPLTDSIQASSFLSAIVSLTKRYFYYYYYYYYYYHLDFKS